MNLNTVVNSNVISFQANPLVGQADTDSKTMTLKEVTDLLSVRHNDAIKVVSKSPYLVSLGRYEKFVSLTMMLDKKWKLTC